MSISNGGSESGSRAIREPVLEEKTTFTTIHQSLHAEFAGRSLEYTMSRLLGENLSRKH